MIQRTPVPAKPAGEQNSEALTFRCLTPVVAGAPLSQARPRCFSGSTVWDDATLERLARALQQPLPDVGDARWTTREEDRPRYALAVQGGEGPERAERARRVADAVAQFVRRNDLTGAPQERLVDFLKVQIKWANEHDLDPGDLWDVMRALKDTKGN